MKTLIATIALALGVSTMTFAEAPKVEKIEPKAAAQEAEKGTASIVDVREADEVAAGMAKPAQWFPLSKVQSDPEAFKAFLGKLPKGKVVFYCAVGGRAGKAAEKAASLGYTAANMGGFKDWTQAGLPTKPKP